MAAFSTVIPVRLDPDSKALDRQAELPPDGRIVTFGVNGGVAEHYGTPDSVERNPTTIDYLVASVGGCLIGTFAGSPRRAKLRVRPEHLTATATGHVSTDDDNVLVLRKIVVDYTLELGPDDRAAADEVHATHASRCPNARSVSGAIEVVTTVTYVDPASA